VSRSTRRPFNRKRKSDLIGRVPDIRSGTLTPAMSAHGWRHSRARPRVRGLAREGLATSIAAAPLMPATASKKREIAIDAAVAAQSQPAMGDVAKLLARSGCHERAGGAAIGASCVLPRRPVG
jgi:hypothetical protein